MATCNFLDGSSISDYGEPYIVAEVNTSHNGNIETAKQMIIQAKNAGCSCVKFQSWSAESLYSKSYYAENPIARRIFDKFSFNEDQMVELIQCCRDNEVAFASTPYSRDEVDFLLKDNRAPYIKVASMDLNNYGFLEFIASTGAPMVVATGMAETDEIRRAVEVIKEAGNTELCLLHCVSIYPPKTVTIRLRNILGLRKEFPDSPIGFSDHSIGTEIPVASVALGVAMIEKHFTLDKQSIGMDNQMATEPEEMARLVQHSRTVFESLGDEERLLFDEEKEQRAKMRRSLIVTRTIEQGTVLGIGDLGAKRPGTGIPPSHLDDYIGKTAARRIECDTLLSDDDIVE